jgi:uncharacterized protein (TIGR03435 family)
MRVRGPKREMTARLVLLGLSSLLAQAGRAQSFEVASIKPVEAGPCRATPSPQSPGIVSYTHFSLRTLIQVAYDVQDEELKSAGWLADSCYDISAKIPTGTGPERVPSMLQQMLADRFVLRVHWESATVKGYRLVVARGGPKLTPAKKAGPDAPPRRAIFRGADVEIHFYGMTMEQFARELSRYTGRATVDATNLAGAYDITFECSTESIAIFSAMQESDKGIPGTSLYTAVRNLGLDLASSNVTQRRLVVDAVSRVPTPN